MTILCVWGLLPTNCHKRISEKLLWGSLFEEGMVAEEGKRPLPLGGHLAPGCLQELVK